MKGTVSECVPVLNVIPKITDLTNHQCSKLRAPLSQNKPGVDNETILPKDRQAPQDKIFH